jgi:anti-anti-sigma factor
MILVVERQRIEPDIGVVKLNGRIVLGRDSQHVELNISHILQENCKKVILDLEHVTLLDSTGMGILVHCHNKVKQAGGQLRIAGANGIVKETLRRAGVEKLIRTYPSVIEASQGF